MDATKRTKRTIVTETSGRTVTVPAGTACRLIECGDRPRWAVASNGSIPEYVAEKARHEGFDSMLVWDLDHHYVWIRDEDIEEAGA